MPESGLQNSLPEPLFFTSYSKSSTEKSPDIIQCNLCPHYCVIKPGKFGLCLVRGCESGGKGVIPYAGKISALAADPIEKKPLYHFFPSSEILSAGFFGCNLKCPFCQNYSISNAAETSAKTVTPREMAEMTARSGTIGLAYTYSEPIVHIEWVAETARLLREKNLKNVLVTNGCINPEPADYLLENIDAANIDLKSFNPDFYSSELKGNLDAVREFIKKAYKKIHIEITTLVIPGKNDSEEEITEIAQFIASLDKKIPLHLSCYYPAYKYGISGTNAEKIFALVKTASEYLCYVYPGNTGRTEIVTRCRSCGEVLVRRKGYHTEMPALSGNRCSKCSTESDLITE